MQQMKLSKFEQDPKALNRGLGFYQQHLTTVVTKKFTSLKARLNSTTSGWNSSSSSPSWISLKSPPSVSFISFVCWKCFKQVFNTMMTLGRYWIILQRPFNNLSQANIRSKFLKIFVKNSPWISKKISQLANKMQSNQLSSSWRQKCQKTNYNQNSS